MASTIDLCQIPAGVSPDGQSNFVNPPSLGPALMAVMGVMVAFSLVFTCIRLVVNIRKLTLSDYFATIALVMAIVILGIETTQLRTAPHIWDVPACYFDASFAKGVFIPALLLQIGAFFAKASIFLLLRQLFNIRRPMRVAVWIGLASSFLIYGVGVIVAIYYETPRSSETWENTLDGRTLIPLTWWQLQSALSVALDIYIFILPLPIVAKLQLPTTRKIALTAVFSLALTAVFSLALP